MIIRRFRGMRQYHMDATTLQATAKRVAPQLQRGIAELPVEKPIYVWDMLLSLLLRCALACLALAPALITRILQGIGWEQPPSEAPQATTILAALAYLVNSFTSPPLKYLWHLNPVEDVVAYIRRREAIPPEQTYEERVMTFSSHQPFVYSRWDDISAELTKDITVIKLPVSTCLSRWSLRIGIHKNNTTRGRISLSKTMRNVTNPSISTSTAV